MAENYSVDKKTTIQLSRITDILRMELKKWLFRFRRKNCKK